MSRGSVSDGVTVAVAAPGGHVVYTRHLRVLMRKGQPLPATPDAFPAHVLRSASADVSNMVVKLFASTALDPQYSTDLGVELVGAARVPVQPGQTATVYFDLRRTPPTISIMDQSNEELASDVPLLPPV